MEFLVTIESGWTGRKTACVKNPSQADAYFANYRGANDITIHRGSRNGPVIGRVDFSSWGQTIYIYFGNDRVEMRKDGIFTNAHAVPLPASPEASPFKWKIGSVLSTGGSLKLVDAKGIEVATHHRISGRRSQIGRMVINVQGLNQELMDQIFVSFLAMEERIRRARGAAGAAAAAG